MPQSSLSRAWLWHPQSCTSRFGEMPTRRLHRSLCIVHKVADIKSGYVLRPKGGTFTGSRPTPFRREKQRCECGTANQQHLALPTASVRRQGSLIFGVQNGGGQDCCRCAATTVIGAAVSVRVSSNVCEPLLLLLLQGAPLGRIRYGTQLPGIVPELPLPLSQGRSQAWLQIHQVH
jgi:hypothetical protein